MAQVTITWDVEVTETYKVTIDTDKLPEHVRGALDAGDEIYDLDPDDFLPEYEIGPDSSIVSSREITDAKFT